MVLSQKVLTARDSYHDFAGARTDGFLDKKLASDVVKQYIDIDFPGNIEHYTYNEYINRDNYYIWLDIPATNVTRASAAFFHIPKPIFVIDRGSLTGCATSPNKYSFAGWYDNAMCTDKKTVSDPSSYAVTQRDEDLLELLSISGSLNQQKAEGNIRLSNKSLVWKSNANDYCRPEVKKYTTVIQELLAKDHRNPISECYGISLPLNTKEQQYTAIMKLFDGKRTGDYIQARSTLDNEVFISQDLMAVVKAASIGKNAIHTYKKGGTFYVKLIKRKVGSIEPPDSTPYKGKQKRPPKEEVTMKQFMDLYFRLIDGLNIMSSKLTAGNIHPAPFIAQLTSTRDPRLPPIYLLKAELKQKLDSLKKMIRRSASGIVTEEVFSEYQGLYDDIEQKIGDLIDKAAFLERKAKRQRGDLIDKEAFLERKAKRQKGGRGTILLIRKYIELIRLYLKEGNDTASMYIKLLETELLKDVQDNNKILEYIDFLLPYVCDEEYFRTFNEQILTLKGVYVLENILSSSHRLASIETELNIHPLIKSLIAHLQNSTLHISTQEQKVHKLYSKLKGQASIFDKVILLEEYDKLLRLKKGDTTAIDEYIVLQNIYYRMLIMHNRYINSKLYSGEEVDMDMSGGRVVSQRNQVLSRITKRKSKMSVINKYAIIEIIKNEINSFIENLDIKAFVELPFIMKRYISKQRTPHTERLLQELFTVYYQDTYNVDKLNTEYLSFKEVIPLDKPSDEKADSYMMFRHYIDIFPEYLDVLVWASVKYATNRDPLYPKHIRSDIAFIEQNIENINLTESRHTV